MIRSLLSVGSSMHHAAPGSPSTSSSGTKTSVSPTSHDPIARIPSFGSSLICTPSAAVGTRKRVRPWCRLTASWSDAREQEDVVGDVGRRAPRLVAVEHPAAVRLPRRRAHGAEQVGAAARLGEADRVAELAARRRRQEFLLLLVGAVEADALRAGERRDPPDPGEPAERAGELPRQEHLHDDVAALAADSSGIPIPWYPPRSASPRDRTGTRARGSPPRAPSPSGTRGRPRRGSRGETTRAPPADRSSTPAQWSPSERL